MKHQDVIKKETKKIVDKLTKEYSDLTVKLSRMCLNEEVNHEIFLNINLMIINSLAVHFYENQIRNSGLTDYDAYKNILFNIIESTLDGIKRNIK